MSVETEIVNISITQDTVAEPSPGFGTALILSHNWPFSDLLRYYEGLDDVAADGWVQGSPEFRAAVALFSQAQKPDRIAIGGSASGAPTLQYTVAVQVVRSNDARAYRINVAGQGFTDAAAAFTSGPNATIEQIHAGLVAALNAVPGKNYSAAFAPLSYAAHTFTAANASELFTVTAHGLKTGDGPLQVSNTGGALPGGLAAATDHWVIRVDANTFRLATSLANALAGTNLLISSDGSGTNSIAGTTATARASDPFTVTGSAPGNWFALELADVTALSVAATHAGDPTAILDAIELEQPDWYCLLTNYNSSAYVQAAATWIEAHTKIYLFDLPETQAIQAAVTNATDTLATLHTAAFGRTAGSYHHRPATFMSAAWAGAVLPIDPGGDTWALKQLVGISMPSRLTPTNRANLRARKANFCTTGFGRSITFDGTTADGDFLDITRGIDWLNDDMTRGIGSVLVAAKKVPYTNQGVTMIVNQIEASLDRAVQRQILAADPKPKTTAPNVDDIDPSIRGQRLLPDIEFEARLAGAIHKVRAAGRVSL